MKHKLITLLSLTIYSSLSFADGQIKAFKQPAPIERVQCASTEGTVVLNTFKAQKGNYLTCDQIDSFMQTLENVFEISPVTPDISLFIDKEYSNASFDMGSIIYVPLRLTFHSQFGMTYYGDFYASHSVLAHEYGHAVFSKMLEQEDFFKELKEISLKISSLRLTIQKTFEAGNPGNMVAFYSDMLKSAEQKRLENKVALKVNRMLSPYHELFADLVAALAAGSKRTMVNALYYDELDDRSYQMVLARDFDTNSLNMKGPYMHEEHGMLAPTRRFIGSNLWAETEEEKKELLLNLYKAIVIEVRKQIASDIDKLSPAQMNENLIKTLSKLTTQE
ncbi:hypothetical protein [Bacteriovorax sp. Seq25_V]|uniref:hypothetical protein n=1 Tax=Bacteriovorax sp. Seq25_V TaxID=1201288 RepID=UPI00038A0CEB|nr:hypothetical protein [Bacteriovorax sp. Seq25_V]EQC47302.1 hypothetical protein M900_0838 [Bacteriovorax sp. Seq25_V]